MDKLMTLSELFHNKIFRIPDYQRGYAWKDDQLKDFWEDLINLSGNRSHYTGVLTLQQIKQEEVDDTANEYWLVNQGYKIYYIVDGQQRLTTFFVFFQAVIDFFRNKNSKKLDDKNIFIRESGNLEEVIKQYLYKTKNSGEETYKLDYINDPPSSKCLRRLSDYSSESDNDETLYTLNLQNAWKHFYDKLENLNHQAGFNALGEIYTKLTQKFLFNVYQIDDKRFDPCVVFETTNNRGKRLSVFELLKNRLIYLTTLYSDKQLNADDVGGRESLRDAINDAWKEVYRQLGRNPEQTLDDDDFLKDHWIMYFQYSRQKDNNYSKFLLDEEFSPQRIDKETASETDQKFPKEQRTSFEMDDVENRDEEKKKPRATTKKKPKDPLLPIGIKKYVDSLKESAVHWFNSHYRYEYYEKIKKIELSPKEKNALDRLNRIGMAYFRPLVMSIFKNESNRENRIDLLDRIERFIFIVFRLRKSRSDAHQKPFFDDSNKFDLGKLTLENIKDELDKTIRNIKLDKKNVFNPDGKMNSESFGKLLDDKGGYYNWNGFEYFIQEYELSLRSKKEQKEVGWEDFPLMLKKKKEISTEHVFPQTPTAPSWEKSFEKVAEKYYHRYCNSIGNLLLLQKSINGSLKNDSFKDKKVGYLQSGLLSAFEVSQYEDWGPAEIKERGLHLLSFMEDRWGFQFENEQAKEDLLFLPKSGDR